MIHWVEEEKRLKAELETSGALESVSGKQLALQKKVDIELLEAKLDNFKMQLVLEIKMDFEKQKLNTTLHAKSPTTSAEFQL